MAKRPRRTKKVVKKTTKKIRRRMIMAPQPYPVNLDHELLMNRTIFLTGVIEERTVTPIIKQLYFLEKRDTTKPIIVWINSIGGEIHSGYALINTFRAIKSKVYTVINGEASSMAGIIAAAGDERYITRGSWWMGHDMSGGIWGDYSNKVKHRAVYIERLWEQLEATLKTYTKLTKADIETLRHGELWLDANEALAKGIVDKVL